MDLPHLEKVHRQHVLWPPVHAASDVLLRRLAAGAEPYEVIWRAIHLWECLETMVAETAMTRLLSLEADDEILRPIRERCHGRIWSETEALLERSIGAFDGSQDRWIEVLHLISQVNPMGSGFLEDAVRFLGRFEDEEGSDSLLQVDGLVAAWGRSCDVPASLPTGHVEARQAMKVMNIFRNRFAHVPFPYDPLDPLAGEVLALTDRLFEIGGMSVFSGAIYAQGRLLQGSNTIRASDALDSPEPAYAYGVKTRSGTADEVWPGAPFIHVDRMMRASLATRLKDQEGLWEYTRYLAEADAVSVKRAPIPDGLRVPVETDYEPLNSVEDESRSADESPTVVDSYDSALTAIRRRDFPEAISFLRDLSQERPAYHVGWLRLGYALREQAAELMYADPPPSRDEIKSLLDESTSALTQAKDHIDTSYQAEAAYQLSKTWYRRWRLDGDDKSVVRAQDEAKAAVQLSSETKYESWVEYLANLHDEEP